MTRGRTLAREAALKLLYQYDLRTDLDDDAAEAFLESEELPSDALAFTRELVEGVRQHGAELDAVIEAVAINWELRRMAAVDRNVLRLGAFELLHRPDVPPAVAINEAVLLGKKYSTRETGAFVNGILDKIHRERAGEDAAPAETPEQPTEAAE